MNRRTKIAAALVAIGLGAAALPAFVAAQGMEGAGPMAGIDFATLDANSDGKISQDEMLAHRKAMAGAVDKDGNGTVSLEEFLAQRAAMQKGMGMGMGMGMGKNEAEGRAKDRFEAMDADGNGQLSAVELLTPPAPTAMIARIDTDGDGAISQAEFDAAKAKMAQFGKMMRKGDRMGGHMDGAMGKGGMTMPGGCNGGDQ